MGSWNGTCLFSNLSICSGEKIVAFVIKYNLPFDKFSGTCYVDDYARPISLPIYGNYNDYGSIERITNSFALTALCDVFKVQNSQRLINSIERDEVDGVGFVMCLESVFNDVVLRSSRYEYQLAAVKKSLAWITKPNVSEAAQLISNTHLGPQWYDVFGADFRALIKKTSTKKKFLDDTAHQITQTVIANYELDLLRKTWVGPSGKGKQDENYIEQLKLAESIKKHVSLRLASYLNGDDYDLEYVYSRFL